MNDGGQFYSSKNTSQSLFLDFIGVPPDSPRRSRQGVYSSLSFGTPPHKTKLLMLDTRFFRDWPLLPSVGSIRLPGSAFIGAFVRVSLAFFGWVAGCVWSAGGCIECVCVCVCVCAGLVRATAVTCWARISGCGWRNS